MVYIIKKHVYLLADLSVAIVFGSLSSINGLDDTLGYESLPLIRVHLIEDGALRFFTLRMNKKRRAIASIRSRIDA